MAHSYFAASSKGPSEVLNKATGFFNEKSKILAEKKMKQDQEYNDFKFALDLQAQFSAQDGVLTDVF
jgi:hypothetical protein